MFYSFFFDDYDGYIMIMMVSTHNKADDGYERQLLIEGKALIRLFDTLDVKISSYYD